MPRFIPEKFPPNANKGERTVFEILKKLPDDCIVCHESSVQELLPDFVVFSPRLGVLIIEVKSFYATTVLHGDQNKIHIRPIRKKIPLQRIIEHPNQKARRYRYRTGDMFMEGELSAELLYPPGHHYEGGLVFPTASCVALTNITRHQIINHPIQQSLAQFNPVFTLFADEVKELNSPNIFGASLENKLSRFFKQKWTFTLSERQLAIIYAILSHKPVEASSPETSINPIKTKVDSLLHEFLEVRKAQECKEKELLSLRAKMHDAGIIIESDLESLASIKKIASALLDSIGDGLTKKKNDSSVKNAEKLFYNACVVKLKAEEDLINKQQVVCKAKINKLAEILELVEA